MPKNMLVTIPPWYDSPFFDEADQAVLLHAGTTYEVLEGADHVALFRELSEGPALPRALARRLAPGFPKAHTLRLLHELVRDSVLVEHVPDLTPQERAASIRLTLPPRQVARALRTRKVALAAFGVEAAPLREALQQWGVSLAGRGDEAAFAVVAAGHWRDARLRAHDAQALAAGRPWLLLVPGGPVPFVGPVFRPPATASFACLAHRLHENDRVGSLLLHAGQAPHEAPVEPPSPLTPVIVQAAAWETVRWIVLQQNPNLDGRLLTFDPETWQPAAHPVRPYSERTRRGLPLAPEAHPVPPVLLPRPKLWPEDGYRTVALEDACARLDPLVSPLTGILRNERRLPAPSGDLLHTYVVDHNAAAETDSFDALYLSHHTTSSGKGTSDLQARTGARYEGLERYSSLWTGRGYAEVNSYREMAPRGAIHPEALQGFSPHQFAARDAWNEAHPGPALFVPEPFDPEAVIPWVPVWSLTAERWRYVPAAFAYLSYPDDERVFCRGDSNGNAAGATLEEAILQGFLELVERDAVSIWFYNRLRRPGVDLSSFTAHPYFARLQAYYRETLHRDVYVLDVTTDFGLPTFVALSRRRDRRPEDIAMGFGTSLDAPSALYRALTEMTQGLHPLLEQHPDGATRYPEGLDPDRLEWLLHATVDANPYLLPDPARPFKTAADYAYEPKADVLDDVWDGVARARAAGLEVCVLDLTREHTGHPAAKVIVPGMVHWWRRLGHGRLYDVPVRLGWLPAPLDEADLNPFSITL